jgi:hypothetical protein
MQGRSGSDDGAGRIRRIADDAWDEHTLTWKNRPPVEGPVLYAHGPIAAGGIAEFALDGVVTGDGVYGFAIDSTARDGLTYHSSSSADGLGPVLVLTLEPRGTSVRILEPSEGETRLAGESIVLAGSATAETGEDLSAAIAWTSSLDGLLGTGAELAVSDLSLGVHVLTAEVTDAVGTTATDAVSFAVTDLVAETLIFPASADTYVDADRSSTSFGAATVLKADASPTRQALLRFVVTGTGAAPVYSARLRLTVGDERNDESPSGGRIHAVSDHDWNEGDTTWATRPEVDGPVLSAQGEAKPNAVLDFDVTGVVAGDGLYDFALSTTSRDGVGFRSRAAASGAPELILSFVPPDEDSPPSVAIAAPADGITVGEGSPLTFFGGALDPEDGDVSASLRWSSSRDGLLGTGEEVRAVLSVGTHTVTATAVDAGLGMGSASIRVTVGTFVAVEGHRYGAGVESNENKATGEKPESKLWYHDGHWWGTLYNPDASAHRIHRLDFATQTWMDQGVTVDSRAKSRQDALSVDDTLYIVSRYADSPSQARLMRYRYTPSDGYQLDPEFPVNISGGNAETLTLARDSTGTLWIAYVGGRDVRVSHTLGSDTEWSAPFTVPVDDTTVGHDDVAAVIAMPGAIGVFWNSHVNDKYYLAMHTDGLPGDDPAAWSLETAHSGRNGADDHINLKLSADGALYVAVKTDFRGATSTQVGLLVRSPDGVWAPLYQVIPLSLNSTRPIVMLDEDRRIVYVFYSKGGDAIYYKSSPMDAIAFAPGTGIPFIRSSKTSHINNATSTKQSVGFDSGLVVVASSVVSHRYWHNAFPPEP